MLFNLQTFWRIFQEIRRVTPSTSRRWAFVERFSVLRRHYRVKCTFRWSERAIIIVATSPRLFIYCSFSPARIIERESFISYIKRFFFLSASLDGRVGGSCTSKHYKKIRCPGNDTQSEVCCKVRKSVGVRRSFPLAITRRWVFLYFMKLRYCTYIRDKYKKAERRNVMIIRDQIIREMWWDLQRQKERICASCNSHFARNLEQLMITTSNISFDKIYRFVRRLTI